MMAMLDNNIFSNLQQSQYQAKNQVLTSFSPFLNNPLLSDVTFIIQNQKFFAHKLVLAARSPYFYTLITHNSQSAANTLEIEIQDASAFVFHQVLQWMYSGVVNWNEYLANEHKNQSNTGAGTTTSNNITNNNNNNNNSGGSSNSSSNSSGNKTANTPSIIWDLFQAGQFYQVKGLCDQCELKIVNQLTRENVFMNWKQAQVYNAINTLNYCVDYVKMEFAKELQHISPQFCQPQSDSYQLQKQIILVMQQQQQQQQAMKGEQPQQGSEIYNSLQQYTFPYKGGPADVSVKKESGTDQTRGTSTPRSGGALPRRSVSFSDQVSVSDSGGKTEIVKFDMWNKNATPPPAYPTPESLAAFPQFFALNSQTSQQQSMADRKLCRRLSVIHGGSTRGVFLQHLISGIGKLLSAERASLFLLMSEEVYSQVALGEKQNNNSERHVMCCPVFGHRGAITGVLEIINGTPAGENHLRTVALLISLFLQETGVTNAPVQQVQHQQVGGQQHSSMQPPPPPQQQQQQQPQQQPQQPQQQPAQQTVENQQLVEPLFADPIASLSQPLSLSSNSYRRQSLVNLQKLGMDDNGTNEFSLFWDGDDNNMDENLGDWNVEDFLRDEDVLNLDASRQSNSSVMGLLGSSSSNPSLLDDLNAGKMAAMHRGSTSVDHPSSKKRKRSSASLLQQQQQMGIPTQQNDPHVPFMHFRIPRYELQFIQFEGGSMKKKKK